MFDFVKVAAAVPCVTVADTAKNTASIIKYLEQAKESNTDIVVFPELCVSGYTCADLFFQKKLIDASAIAVGEIVKKTDGIIAVFGAPVEAYGQLYNCGIVAANGKIYGIVPKTFLPNYNEYYEKRWFSASTDLSENTVSAKKFGLEEYSIPIGRNLVFEADGIKFGAEICEDLWAPVPPSSFLALGGAEIIFNLSASNETISKRNYRRNLILHHSASNICGYVYASAGSGESTTDLVFSGYAAVSENGTMLAESDRLISDEGIVCSEIDVGKIKADRLKLKSFKDCKKAFYAEKETHILIDNIKIKADGKTYKINKLPFVPASKEERMERCMEIFEMQVGALKKRMKVAGCNLVVGVSGGLDSTLALLVSAMAVKELNCGKVIGITMPCFGTSDRTYNNAVKLIESLGAEFKEINIKNACNLHFADIGHDGKTLDLTFENAQARERTQVLMDYAGMIGGFVVGTGDLSELALGWCTYNADHMSMYGVNSGVPKTLVRWMIESLVHYNIFPDSTEVLKDIADTPISPELLPPDAEGKIAQVTEDIVGPYALHDFFLYYILRFGFEPEKIYHLAKMAFKDDFDSETILKWLKNFYKRFFSQQFKRSCLPDGVKIGSVCLSPRGDWRMPSDASAAIWLKEAENL
ncbi:MAG: NAD(+) synthase [Ruminococcaceae bacterium]|jgi:NAD+ synthase (glutamine-hydrolysing)|nr:NAD(+) synthase [Oscillospiraceae bacterium]